MTLEGHSDVSLPLSGLPAGQAAANFDNHRDLEQAAAHCTQETTRCKNSSEQKFRHRSSQQVAVSPTFGFNGQRFTPII